MNSPLPWEIRTNVKPTQAELDADAATFMAFYNSQRS